MARDPMFGVQKMLTPPRSGREGLGVVADVGVAPLPVGGTPGLTPSEAVGKADEAAERVGPTAQIQTKLTPRMRGPGVEETEGSREVGGEDADG